MSNYPIQSHYIQAMVLNSVKLLSKNHLKLHQISLIPRLAFLLTYYDNKLIIMQDLALVDGIHTFNDFLLNPIIVYHACLSIVLPYVLK